MAVDTRFNVPFIPQEGITSQILSAIQLANEQHFRQQQLGIQQQQTDIAAQKAPAEIEEAKARAGFYGSEAQRNQIQTDNMKRAQQMFGPSAQPAEGAAPPPQNTPWLPSNTPGQLAPFVTAMIPTDLNDQEKNVIESGAQAGRFEAMQAGDISKYLNSIRSGVDTVVASRNKNIENQPVQPDERKNFLQNVLPSMENLSPAQKTLATAAVNGAKSHKDLDAIQARLMAQDNQALTAKVAEANRVSNERLQHSLQLDTDGRNNIIKNNTKWSDAYTQIQLGNKQIQAAANGDDLATRMIPTMEVLGINMTGGIRRISPTEYEAARIPASWANRFNSWVDAKLQGKTTPEMVKEGKQLFDDLADARYSSYLAEQKTTADNFKMDRKDVSVIDNNGQAVTLDKALKNGPRPAAASQSSGLSIGDQVTIGGKQLKITKVYPDGTFDAE